MMPKWEADMALRERAQFYERATTKWCLQAGEWHDKYKRVRREARGAEIIAALLAVVVWWLVVGR